MGELTFGAGKRKFAARGRAYNQAFMVLVSIRCTVRNLNIYIVDNIEQYGKHCLIQF